MMLASQTASPMQSLPMTRLRGLQSTARELPDTPVEVRGQVPSWMLGGSLLLNGPALWDLPHGSYGHWFDGLAMLHRVRLAPGEVGGASASYRSRYLQTDDLRESLAARKPARAAFGTADPAGFFTRMRHLRHPNVTDNGAVVMARIGSQWVAQTETPLLTSFDPDTLATTGRIVYDDREVIHVMSAHGMTDAQGTYWNVGLELGPKCTYKLFKIVAGSRTREVVARWSVRQAGYLHAFAMTPTHAIVWQPAMRLNALKLAFSGKGFIDSFAWKGEAGSRIDAISLTDGGVRSWAVPAMTGFHAVQAWDEPSPDGRAPATLVLDLCTTDGPEIFAALRMERLRAGQPVGVQHRVQRYRLEPGRSDAQPLPLVDAASVELPSVHGAYWGKKQSRHAWFAGFDPEGQAPMFDRTVKLDLEAGRIAGTWQRESAVQMEPLFVDRPGSTAEDDGVLLVPTLAEGDAGTVVGVIDPASMRCLATLHLPQVVPFGFHAAWKPAWMAG
jgi:carotenoid cleavage dioxygenase-like enzyme